MKTLQIDLNCDLGEGTGNEALIMPYISSCNIACGGHAGDLVSIREVATLARQNKVRVGAHPSFVDRENFGRKALDTEIQVLKEQLREQINRVQSECDRQNWPMHHIKPHGALYNLCNVDKAYGEMIVKLIEQHFPEAKLYAPANSMIAEVARGRITVCQEGFADRNYNPDHTLVSRTQKKAILTKKEEIFEHVFGMITAGKIKAVDGSEIEIQADTICVHGDNPQAVEIVRFLNEKLKEKGVKITGQ